MSSVVIVSLIAAGVVILMLIVYANHMIEANKLEKARQRADLTDRMKRCTNLFETLPGQFVPAKLKLLLARIELGLGQRLLPLERNNAKLSERVNQLEALVQAGEPAMKPNAALAMDKETKVKDFRFQLEALHGQLGRASHDGIVSDPEARLWVEEIKKCLVLAHCELFESIGRQALNQKQPRQARLAYERGVQYLRKQPDQSPFKSVLSRLEEMLEQTEALVLAEDMPHQQDSSELTDGIDTIQDDGWKKKNVYD
jgi:hypothetical protein